jgi:hypothetical protein
MQLAWLARAQMLCAAGILIWMAAGLGAAARDEFQPARERYGQLPIDAAGALTPILSRLPAQGGRVLLLGTADFSALSAGLEQRGVEVRHLTSGDPVASAAGIDLLCIGEAREEFLQPDFQRLASVMRAKIVFDLTTFADEGAADAAGLELIVYGRPQWPPWLDPEYLRFVEYVRARVPEGAAILLIPSQAYQNPLPRSRWFLHLNYALAPRRLHLWRPELASGYVMQYFSWVEAVNAAAPWRGAKYLRIKDRALTKLSESGSAPTRSLSPQELEAARQIGAEWVLLFTPNTGFRLVDWELLPLERVRGWSEQSQ